MDPKSIEDAELQVQGIDPRLVSAQEKSAVSSVVISRLTGQEVTVKFDRGRFRISEAQDTLGEEVSTIGNQNTAV